MTLTKTHIITWLEQSAQVFDENKVYLTELDSPIGDADHGSNIARGFKVVVEKLPTVADKEIGAIFKLMAMTLMYAVGGASGMLYGNFFMKAAAVANGKDELTHAEVVAVFVAGTDGIIQRGRAEVGDKTMIDAWNPALDALQNAVDNGQSLTAALQATAAAAEAGMKATIPLQARKGRASYLGERSIGHQDPGATSTYLLLNELAKAVQDESH